jgi:NAD(P)-dependent dehydrogenase (short-subunit alcohol dehydrogenase family)
MTAPSLANWLITGCSTGLGRALALRVLAQGYRCVVTSRDAAAVADIVAAHPATARAVALDVKDPVQRAAAIRNAVDAFGSIDVLVNNAGHGYVAAIEEGEEAPIREMFDTNVFALAALTREVLPLMRAQRRGHIVNISSVGGLVGNPASGYYCATKFAVEGISEALAAEVAPLGLRVTAVEPGPFRTDFLGRSIVAVGAEIPAYAATAGARRRNLLASSGRQRGDPVRAADAIITVVESPTPPLHLVLGADGFDRARTKLQALLASMEEWEPVSRGADYDD